MLNALQLHQVSFESWVLAQVACASPSIRSGMSTRILVAPTFVSVLPQTICRRKSCLEPLSFSYVQMPAGADTPWCGRRVSMHVCHPPHHSYLLEETDDEDSFDDHERRNEEIEGDGAV